MSKKVLIYSELMGWASSTLLAGELYYNNNEIFYLIWMLVSLLSVILSIYCIIKPKK